MTGRAPIVLITGSLGSGKTTLLRRILKDSTRRLAVLMNEFGEIAIDSRVLTGENVQIVELMGGCVCCSLTGEFEAAVREILEKIHPECIVVEATGVAEADALVYEVEDNLPEVRLDSIICIVDVDVTVRCPHMGYTTRTQLEVADIVLINKVDLVTTDEMNEVEAQVRRANSRALFFKTVGCDVDVSLLFGLESERPPLSMSHHGDAEFQSFHYDTEKAFDREKFETFLAGLPPSLYRSKGFVRLDGETFLFNYVVGRSDLEPFPAEHTRLVFIGRGLEAHRDKILAGLRECEQ